MCASDAAAPPAMRRTDIGEFARLCSCTAMHPGGPLLTNGVPEAASPKHGGTLPHAGPGKTEQI
ncbi:hypothetical protein thsps21_17300 [Pseudomonas sp. No.21]|nr:hypothetical protein TUM20249_36680 [Pseudomonas tohonis]